MRGEEREVLRRENYKGRRKEPTPCTPSPSDLDYLSTHLNRLVSLQSPADQLWLLNHAYDTLEDCFLTYKSAGLLSFRDYAVHKTTQTVRKYRNLLTLPKK